MHMPDAEINGATTLLNTFTADATAFATDCSKKVGGLGAADKAAAAQLLGTLQHFMTEGPKIFQAMAQMKAAIAKAEAGLTKVAADIKRDETRLEMIAKMPATAASAAANPANAAKPHAAPANLAAAGAAITTAHSKLVSLRADVAKFADDYKNDKLHPLTDMKVALMPEVERLKITLTSLETDLAEAVKVIPK
ncbi:MAG TPA: hypothetical protein VGN88_03715 [Phycisphaerae bacterium]